MKTEGNDPANPFFKWNESGYGDTVTIYDANGGKQFLPYEQGLTKREYFAVMAMQGLIADPAGIKSSEVESNCQRAIRYADVLINELNKDLDLKKNQE